MKNKLLLPGIYRLIGSLLLILSAYLYFSDAQFAFLSTEKFKHWGYHSPNAIDVGNDNLTDEFALTGIFVGLLMIAFARLKNEDEYTSYLRLTSLQWAIVLNYLLMIICTWFIYGTAFLGVPLYNLVTPLLIFIIRFYGIYFWGKRRAIKIKA